MAPPTVKDRMRPLVVLALLCLSAACCSLEAAEGEPALTGIHQAAKAAAEALKPFCVEKDAADAGGRAANAAIALLEAAPFLDGYVAALLAFYLQEAGVESQVAQTDLLAGPVRDLPEAMRPRLAAHLESAGGRVGVLFCLTQSEGGRSLHAAVYALGDGRPLGETNGRFQIPEDVQALMAAEDGKLSDADRDWLELLAHLLPPFPSAGGSAQARLVLAEARYMFSRGRWAEAATRFARLSEGKPTLCLAYAVLSLESAAGGAQALGLVEEALKRQPDSGPLYAIKGWLLLRHSSPDDALMLLEQARLSDVRREGYYWLARYLVAIERENKETAAQALFKAAEIMPADAYVQLRVARFYWRAAELDKSVEYYRKAIKADPDDSALWSECGVALGASGHPDEAVEAFREAVRLDPGNSGAVRQLSGLLKSRGRHEEALEILKKGADARPDRLELLAGYAETAAEMGRLEAAEESYRAAIARDPDFLPAKVGLAQVRSRRRSYDEAQRILEDVLRQHPDHQPARLALGPVLAALGRTEDAVEVLKAAARSPDFSAAAHVALARLHNSLGQHDEAVRSAQIAMTARANAESSAVLARAFVGLKDWEKAETAIKSALETWPGSCEVQLAAAELAAGREDYEQALQAAQKAVEANPCCRDAFLLAGELQLKLDRPAECVKPWLRALELDRWDAALNWKLAELLRTRLNDPKTAVVHYKRHIELKGEHAQEAEGILREIQPAPQGG